MDEFLQRLKQRKLIQWALAYLAAAFALIQVLDVIGHQFGWPELVGRALTLVAACGFFFVLLLAWYHGERGAQRVSGPELMLMTLLLAIAGGLLWRLAPPEPASTQIALGAPNGAGARARASATPTSAPVPVERGSIAVLPFANLSADKDTAYFVEGVRDMILTRLATVGDLKVISRTSTDQYGSQPADLKTIALQLGVGSVLEGSVQKAGNQVLINVQLIDAGNDRHLWAEAYKRTMGDVFGVEGEVAQTVAEALNAKLISAEQRSIGDKPTTDPEALDLFLRGEHQLNLETGAGLDGAIALYEMAVARDPAFGLAWARLSYARAYMYFHPYGDHAPTDEAAERVLLSAERALAVGPQLPEANLAMGYYQYWVRLDLPRALASFETALKLRPNDANAMHAIGLIVRRFGRFDAAVGYLEAANRIDPRNTGLLGDATVTEVFAARYSVATRINQRKLALDPGDFQATMAIAWQKIMAHDDIAGAVAMLDGSYPAIVLQRAEFLEWQKDFRAAIALVESVPDTPDNFREPTKPGRLGTLYLEAGDQAAARPFLLEARKRARATRETIPDDYPNAAVISLNVAYYDAALGDHEGALEATRAALARPMAQREKNFLGWVDASENAMSVYAIAHRADLVVQLVEQMFNATGGLAIPHAWLRLSPELEPIRSDPAFQALLKAHPGSGERFASE